MKANAHPPKATSKELSIQANYTSCVNTICSETIAQEVSYSLPPTFSPRCNIKTWTAWENEGGHRSPLHVLCMKGRSAKPYNGTAIGSVKGYGALHMRVARISFQDVQKGWVSGKSCTPPTESIWSTPRFANSSMVNA